MLMRLKKKINLEAHQALLVNPVNINPAQILSITISLTDVNSSIEMKMIAYCCHDLTCTYDQKYYFHYFTSISLKYAH